MRWIRRALPVVVVLMSTSMSCAGSGGTAAAGEVRADVPRAHAGVEDAKRAARSVNRLGLDLLRADLGQDKGNVAMSPWSIATALTMVRAGARGATAAEMDQVLHLMDVPDVHQAMNGLAQEIAGRNGKFPGDRAVELNTANRVFAQRGLRFETPFLDVLARNYGAGLGLVDYETGAEDARRAINAWVDGQTDHRIPDLLSPGTLDALTRMVLVNAVYLKADWAAPFPKDQTAPGLFHAPRGDVRVPFMRASERRRFVAGDSWKAVELVYAGGKLAMTVLVPDAGRYDDVAGRLSPDMLDGVFDGSAPVEVDLQLPKFDIGHSMALASRLADLGMSTAFTDRADFSGMTTEEALQIAQVVHQANVTVDEKGTVAAAATAGVMRATSAPLQVEQLVVDRPFLFAIRDLPTGAVLFAGQVTNPAQTR